jgi:hypothetical protein
VNEIDDDRLKDVLDAACAAAAASDFQSVVTVAGEIRSRATSDEDPIRALQAALEYHLVIEQENRRGYGPFGPMMEMGGTIHPAPLAEMRSDAVDLWARAAPLAAVPLVQARFADLLWERRYGDRPPEWAGLAVDQYVAAPASGFGEPMELTEGLQRALELSIQLKDAPRLEEAVRAAVTLARETMDGEDRIPGVPLRLIDSLATLRADRRPPELDDLIDQALDRYGDDPWNLESTLGIRSRLVDAADRPALWRQAVESFAGLARRTDGLVKYAHFQHAIELAEEHGLRDDAERLRREVEELSEDALDLHAVSAEVEVPREQIDQFIDAVVGDDDLESALTRFGSHLPSGLPDENRALVAQLMAEHPLQFLFTKMVIGPENSLVRSIGEDDQADQALTDHEAQRASMFSIFAVEMLDRMSQRYGSLAQASKWFESELIEPEVAERLGRAMELYESGDPDSAAALLAPRLERVIRRIASLVGLTVTKSPDRRGNPGGVKGLGQLIGALEGALAEPTRRYLRVLLSEVTGLNLRNRVGHGLADLVAQREAALLIHAACHVRLLQPGPGAAEPPSEPATE